MLTLPVRQSARKSTTCPSRLDCLVSRRVKIMQTKKYECQFSQKTPKSTGVIEGSQICDLSYKPVGKLALKDIRITLNTNNMLIPRIDFHRMVREITQIYIKDEPYNYQVAALQALQEAAEAYLVHLFEDKELFTLKEKKNNYAL